MQVPPHLRSARRSFLKGKQIHSTNDELEFIENLGTYYDNYRPPLSTQTPTEQLIAASKILTRRRTLLNKYLELIPARENWGNIDKEKITAFVISEIMRFSDMTPETYLQKYPAIQG
jgi:hypothetical protein